MNRTRPFCLYILCFALGGTLAAQQQDHRDPLAQALIPPNEIFKNADRVGITEQQQAKIREAVGKVHESENPEAKQAKLKAASQALDTALRSGEIDETVALRKLDDLLTAEAEMKRIHLRILIASNQVLTTEQKEKLGAMQKRHQQDRQKQRAKARELENRLQSKMERIKREVEEKVQAGEHPSEIPPMMEEFSQLMQQGRHEEAEKVLNHALKTLGLEKTDPPAKNEKASLRPGIMAPELPGAASLDDLKERIDELRVPDVAWRKIDWKTCLLEGIQASVDENKPIITWMFIDLPLDDKRC